jgi:hypothetical protein
VRILGWPEGVIADADSRSELLVINYRNERGDSDEIARGHEFGREGVDVDAYMKTKSVWAQL